MFAQTSGETVMTLNDELDILRRLKIFSAIAPSQLKLLAFASDRIIFKQGQELFRVGDEADSAIVILTGEAENLLTSQDGVTTTERLKSCSLVGESALLNNQVRTSTVTAMGKLEALVITRDSFKNLLAHSPDAMSNMLNALGDRMNLHS